MNKNKHRLQTINECLNHGMTDETVAEKKDDKNKKEVFAYLGGNISFKIAYDEKTQKISGSCSPGVGLYKERIDENKAPMVNEQFRRMKDDLDQLTAEFERKFKGISDKYGFGK